MARRLRTKCLFKSNKRLWMKPCFSDFNNVEIKIRKSLEIQPNLSPKLFVRFFSSPKSLKTLHLITYSCFSRVSLKIWLFRQFYVQKFSGDTKLHELILQRCKLCRLSCVMYWILKERFYKKIYDCYFRDDRLFLFKLLYLLVNFKLQNLLNTKHTNDFNW